MASACTFLHFLMLSCYFIIRYILSLNPLLGPLELDDAFWFHAIEHVMRVGRAVRAHPKMLCLGLLVPLNRSIFYHSSRWITKNCFFVGIALRSIKSIKEDTLWKLLSEIVTFTRLSSGKQDLGNSKLQMLPRSRGYQFLLVFVPILIRLAIIWMVLVPVFQILMIWLPTSQEPKHTGLWAKIPSCYDGDTCHSQGLRYGNQLLPDLFSTLNIRILGIDSPELRTAECELEYCLAVQAKLELERILGAGDDKLVSLVNCRHDKYGGRITCDILAGDGRSAASAMLETGLAVPYHGKRKTHSWCDVSRMDDRLYRHAVNCGWEMGETEAERDDDSYEDEDGYF